MTPARLHAYCDRLNGEEGRGGATRLSAPLEWSERKLCRKPAGEAQITRDEEPAITHPMECEAHGRAGAE